jgi:hypothetical protein
VIKGGIFEDMCLGIRDSPMRGTEVKNIFLISIYCSYAPENSTLTLKSNVGF